MSIRKLNSQAEETFFNEDIIRLIKTSEIALEIAEAANENGKVSRELIAELQQYYDDLDLRILLFLWHDQYNSMMVMKDAKNSKENFCSYLVRHKVIALGLLITKILEHDPATKTNHTNS